MRVPGMRLSLFALAGLVAVSVAEAHAIAPATLPVEPGSRVSGQPNFFATRSGDVIVEYYTGTGTALKAHFYDLEARRLILADQATRLAGDPHALLAVIDTQGWAPLRPSPRITAGGTTAEIDQLAGTSCGWVYPGTVAFHDAAGRGLHGTAIFVPAEGGARTVTVQRNCEQSTGSLTLHARYREVFPALVAAPDGHSFLASFAGLPALLSFDASGRPTKPPGARLLVLTPGEVVTTSIASANAAGASAQAVLDRTDAQISSFSNRKDH